MYGTSGCGHVNRPFLVSPHSNFFVASLFCCFDSFDCSVCIGIYVLKLKYRGMFETHMVRRHDNFMNECSQH